MQQNLVKLSDLSPELAKKYNRFLLVLDDCKTTKMVGKNEALNLASDLGLDVVVVLNSAKRVCKLMDFNKFCYEKKKSIKENNHQTTMKIKELSIHPDTSMHDLTWKANNVNNWLQANMVVRIVMKAKGRMSTKTELIHETYQKLLSLITVPFHEKAPLKKINDNLYELIILQGAK